MKTIWVIYSVILVYYLLGTIGIYFINRRKEPDIRHRAWIKHITYFIVTSIVFFSIGINPVAFRIVAVLIIIAGFLEMLKLFKVSGFAGKGFFTISFVIMVLMSLGFILFSMKEKGLGKNAPVILISRSGDRSSKAADRLQMAGFTRVYSVAEGFEGDTEKDGEKLGQRVVNGWKNADLPWTYKLDKAKMYFPH